MEKFKELLFLKNIKGVKNSKINKNYKDVVTESENYIDLISHEKITSKFSKENIVNACSKTSLDSTVTMRL